MIGQDFEQLSGKSRQIISGLDTTCDASDQFLSGTWSSVTNADTTILADFYAHSDQVLVIVGGQMLCRWEVFFNFYSLFEINKHYFRSKQHSKIYEKT